MSSTYGLMTTPSQGDSDIESYGLPEAYGIKDENLWLAQPCHAAIASDYSAGDRNYLLGDEGLSGSYEMPCGAEGVGAVGMSSDGEEEKRLREVEREAAVGKREAEERGARGIDWNEEFQKLVGMLGETGSGVGLHVAKGARKLLYKLCDDFRSLCELYSQIIVTEAHLPRRLKTIPPADVGGYAGGTKFIVANIFFKFALSDQSTPIYPDDERAMKVAGHELRALTALSGASIGAGESIHFPLMCLVDFKGFRVICQSILPISRRSTLVYGSTNAGQSIEDGQTVTLRSAASEKPSTVFQVMRRVCSRLNLKAHAPRQHPAKVIYGPVDIEGHLGYDGRFYLLDVARLFPPKYFTRQQYQLGQQLWDQLRPELVIQFSSPLSSDALSNFQHSSETQSNREIRDATRFLTDVQVPLVASLFNAKPPDSDLSNTAHQQELVSTLHERGVNLKYMGLVRSRVTAASWRTLLLLEIVARTLKNEMRLMLRETHSQGEHVQKLTLLKTFRKLIGTHHASHSFWEQLKPIFLRRFPNSLTIEELDPSFDLLQHISLTDAFVEPGIPRAGLYGLVCRVQRICGLKFTRSSKTLIKTNLCDFDFTLADFIGFQPICKDMAISSYTQAMVFHEKALKRGGSKGSDRLASLSRRKFTETLERQPNNVAYLEGYASALRQTAAVEQSGYQRYKLLKQV
ncbi:MAG: hypothetical protein Q8P67_17670 [archaeon]|nr:hypothetical protein [archaeon]